jgi:predicted aminopeptidase
MYLEAESRLNIQRLITVYAGWKVSLLLVMVLLSGCETISYYSQAVTGQWQMWNNRQSIDQLLADSKTDEALKQRLKLVKAIRQFASEHLLLPSNNSYLYFTDLQRPYAVWNVVATEAFSVDPKEWCFPIAGCVHYRGYFSEQAAIDYADKLADKGFDTNVRGVSAYSTLGWFDDPLLNTFISYDEIHLAGLIFHELAHQHLYLPGDTSFNESFARAVEIAGLTLWLNSPERLRLLVDKPPENSLSNYLQEQRIEDEFVGLMFAGRQQLEELYQRDIDRSKMLQLKQQLIDSIKASYRGDFQTRWSEVDGYANWVNDTGRHRRLNNAKLASMASYYQWITAFQRLLLIENNNLHRFYLRLEYIARDDEEKRELTLRSLIDD